MADESTQTRRPFPRIVPDEAIEHARNARDEMRKSIAALLPSPPAEFLAHRRAARRETLLAIRSLIDRAIEHVDKTEAKVAD